MARTTPDYWDYATLLELAVLASNEIAAEEALSKARTLVRERWEPKTTARNLSLIQESRRAQPQAAMWIERLRGELTKEF